MKRRYFICKEDSYGQRTGVYAEVMLSDDQIAIDRFGHKTYRGSYLYEDEIDVVRACQF